MKLERLSAIRFLLLAILIVLPVAFAGVAPAHAAESANADTLNSSASHEEGIGTALVHILAHHLVDSEEFELFGLTVPLPTIHLGSVRFITKHQVWWVIAMLLVFLVVAGAARQKTLVPSGLRNVLEVLVLFVRNEVVGPNLHGLTDAFLPYFLTLFCSILFSNLLGLLPWGTTSTGNVNVTAGLSLCTLSLMVGMGVKENGLGGFLRQFTPPGVPLWLMPLIIVVEFASFLIRPFALTIRLFANMFAGHAVYFVILGLILSALFVLPALAVAAGVFLLEIVVALIQSYIFIMLTAVFVGLTMHPAH